MKLKLIILTVFVPLMGVPLAWLFIFLNRFYPIYLARVDIHRIGGTLGFYFNSCEMLEAGKHRLNWCFFNYDYGESSNIYWEKQIADTRTFIPRFIAHPLWHALQSMDKGKSYCYRSYGQDQYKGGRLNPSVISSIRRHGGNVFKFKAEDENIGRKVLFDSGVVKDQFICIGNRDSKYVADLYPNRDMSYHDYRNFGINDMSLAVDKLINLDINVVRVGKNVSNSLDVQHELVFDYSQSLIQSDFMDIYLMAKCKFGIFADGGISTVSELHSRPVLYINFPIFSNCPTWTPFGRIIFKKIRKISTGEIIPYRKVYMEIPIENLQSTSEWEEFDIEIINNSPEEIANAAIEFNDTIDGHFEVSDFDRKLQSSFWGMFNEPYPVPENFQIATTFLRSNHNLFE